MKYNEFIGEVQQKAKLSSSEQAVRSVRAALTTLAERIPAREAHNLASRLPKEIGVYLTTAETQLPAKPNVRDFIQQISDREDVTLARSVHNARVVFDVLRQTVSEEEFKQVLSLLPEEFDELLAAPAKSPVRSKKPLKAGKEKKFRKRGGSSAR